MVFGLFRKNSKDGMDSSPARNKNRGSSLFQKILMTGTETQAGPGYKSIYGCTALVTGSSGMCGARLVEMLLERGAQTVICFDLKVPDVALQARFDAAEQNAANGGKLIYCHGREHGDLTSDAAVDAAFQKAKNNIDVVYHIAALVGPFFDTDLYYAVNYHGTMRILEMCQKYKVPKLVFSSSPSTRFTGADVTGQREEELPMPNTWLAMYAETKAKGEQAVSAAHGTRMDDSGVTLQTISIAPHQVYGPHDALMLPNLLETAGHGLLRIFGSGRNKISVCFADNYAHGLMCGADALDEKDRTSGLADTVGGKFYIITDGEPVYFWKFINQAILAMGFANIEDKFHLPTWLLYSLAYLYRLVAGR
jgi:nucleoside-diphosphate-sugar epimerase